GVDKISFTGGTATGKIVMRAAAGTLKKVSLELGGKSPNIVFADADLAGAVRGALSAIFYNQGEVCTAGSRLLAERAIYERVLEEVVAGAKKIVPGDPLDPQTKMGPLVSAEQQRRVLGFIDKGVEEGARKHLGGRKESPGFFVDPTVFSEVAEGMQIA